jgi:hypothetical protein
VWFLRRRNRPLEEASEALRDARRGLHEVKQRSKEVSDVAEALRQIRERNHFAEQLEAIIVRNGGPRS